jgi:hypothetical protein
VHGTLAFSWAVDKGAGQQIVANVTVPLGGPIVTLQLPVIGASSLSDVTAARFVLQESSCKGSACNLLEEEHAAGLVAKRVLSARQVLVGGAIYAEVRLAAGRHALVLRAVVSPSDATDFDVSSS